jgi:hypothetical protein
MGMLHLCGDQQQHLSFFRNSHSFRLFGRRHRTAFMKGGKDRLASELQLDFDRLWVRNLGRDDRVISEHGREVRFPFLDAQFVSFVRGLDLDDVCDFSLKPGTGDKKILRDVCYSALSFDYPGLRNYDSCEHFSCPPHFLLVHPSLRIRENCPSCQASPAVWISYCESFSSSCRGQPFGAALRRRPVDYCD